MPTIARRTPTRDVEACGSGGATERAEAAGGGLDLHEPATEERLVLAHQAGDRSAFQEIDRRYRPVAQKVCRRLLRNAADAEEATQETMVRVLRGLATFNGRYQLRAWVARIATNVCLDVLRASSRRGVDGDQSLDLELDRIGETTRESDHVADAVERSLIGEQVRSTLRELPDKHRRALVLREWGGLSHDDIAAALGMTPAQAKALLHRARHNFRQTWTARGRGAMLIPSVLVHLMPAGLRRILRLEGLVEGTVSQAAHVAASPIGQLATSSAVQVAASSAAHHATCTISEKTVAAVTALVVGLGGAGVAASEGRRHDEPRPTVTASPEPATRLGPVRAAETEDHDLVTPRESLRSLMAPEPQRRHPAPPPPDRQEPVAPAPPAPAEPHPSPSPSPSTEAQSSPPPPSPASSPSPWPSPAQPPKWSFRFTSETRFADCECKLRASQSVSEVQGRAGDELSFRQVIRVRAVDSASGSKPWEMQLEYEAATMGRTGTMDGHFYVRTADGGWYPYRFGTTVESVTSLEDGSIVYTFTGSYAIQNAPPEDARVPREGRFSASFHFWSDGESLYRSSFRLHEA